jgi:drug/metabolite transporter (DMT)-like permease
MNDVRRAGVGLAVTAAAVSGVAVFVNGLAVKRFDDATVYTTAKNLVAGVVLVIALVLNGHRSRRVAATLSARKRWPSLLLVAAIGGSVPFVLFFEGLSRATSTNAAFIHKTLIIWVAIGAAVVLRESITWAHAAAIGLLLLGHLMLTNGVGVAGFGSAEVLVLIATLLWTLEVLIVKRLLPDVPAQIAATSRMAGGSVLLAVWLAIKGDLGVLGTMTATQWSWLLLTGLTLAGFVTLWYSALAMAPAVDVSAILVVGAVITGALDVGFRGAPLTTDSFGYALIALGVGIVAARPFLGHHFRRGPTWRTHSVPS